MDQYILISNGKTSIPLVRYGFVTAGILTMDVQRDQRTQQQIDLYKGLALNKIVKERNCTVIEAAMEFDTVDKLFNGAYLLLLDEEDREEGKKVIEVSYDTTALDYRISLATSIIKERMIHHVTLARPYEGSDTLYLEKGWGLLEVDDRLLFGATTIKINSVVEIEGDYRAKIEPIDQSIAINTIGLVRSGERRFRTGAKDWTEENTKALSQAPEKISQLNQIYDYFQAELLGIENKEEVDKVEPNPFILNPNLPNLGDSANPALSTGENSGSEAEPWEFTGNGSTSEPSLSVISLT